MTFPGTTGASISVSDSQQLSHEQMDREAQIQVDYRTLPISLREVCIAIVFFWFLNRCGIPALQETRMSLSESRVVAEYKECDGGQENRAKQRCKDTWNSAFIKGISKYRFQYDNDEEVKKALDRLNKEVSDSQAKISRINAPNLKAKERLVVLI